MLIVDTRLPKLCHATPGSVIRIPDKEGIPDGDYYMVCVNPKEVRPNKVSSTYGLYDEKNPLFLVNLSTGEAKVIPHLSSRAEILYDAELHVKER